MLSSQKRIRVLALARKPTKVLPNHLTFGIHQLKLNQRFEVLECPTCKFPWIDKIGNFLDIHFLEEQIRTLLILNKVDIVYAPQGAAVTKLILIGKFFKLVRTPIAILATYTMFGKPSKFALVRNFVRRLIGQYQLVIFLSKEMHAGLCKAYEIADEYSDKHFRTISWGVDAEYYASVFQNSSIGPKLLISSGVTNRDFDILIRIASRINAHFRIYCTSHSYPKLPNTHSNVEILSGNFSYDEICSDCAKARLILVPLLNNQEGPSGITSLFEAMAIGKPVIISKNENIDLEVETEGIGFIIPELDEDLWVARINAVLEDEALAIKMGEKARALTIRSFHIDRFAEGLAEALLFVSIQS